MDIWTFALATIALWRVCRLLSYEDGPFFLILRFRILIGIAESEDSIIATNWFALLFTCPLCLSIWLSVPLILLLGGDWLHWLALSGTASFLLRISDPD